MIVPLTSRRRASTSQGFSVLELLIVVVMILIVISYIVTQTIQAQKPLLRTDAAQQFANYLERARNDSMRRHASDVAQMAQVTILNDRFYTVTMDSDGDGVLDAPLVVGLAERHLKVGGPFPRNFMFDWQGRVVDSDQKLVHSPVITLANESGTSVVKLSDIGRPSVVQSGSPTR